MSGSFSTHLVPAVEHSGDFAVGVCLVDVVLVAEHGVVRLDGGGDFVGSGGEEVVGGIVPHVEPHNHRPVIGAAGGLDHSRPGPVVLVQGAVNRLGGVRIGRSSSGVAHGGCKGRTQQHGLLHSDAVPEQIRAREFLPQITRG